jgi:hypothetical protein
MYKPPTQNLGEKDIPFNTEAPFQRLATAHGFTGPWNALSVTPLNPKLFWGLKKVNDMEKQLLLREPRSTPFSVYDLKIKITIIVMMMMITNT